MRAWTLRRAQSTALPTSALRTTRSAASSHVLRLSTTPGRHAQPHEIPRRQQKSPLQRRYPVFERIEPPQRNAAAWLALLDGALPPHLRDPDVTPPDLTLGAVEVAQILLAAQYPLEAHDEPVDLLYHLGVEQNRWSAVVWLIKKLVDKFPIRHSAESPLVSVGSLWRKEPALWGLGDQPIDFDVEDAVPSARSHETRTMDQLLDGAHPENKTHEESLGHDALGQVWRTLGFMIKVYSGEETRTEVLEIIAYLHHREVMPLAIYQAEPNPDRIAIQQPPLIPFLSSRILTSLSDAAWRAHEKLVVEEARANGSPYAALRPEIPGSVFRVHVAGLRPEVWMELLLWSCLYGGWIRQGAEVLQCLIKDKTDRWTPLSWIDYQKSLPDNYQTEPRDWKSWEFLFKTRSADSMDDSEPPRTSVERTISGEVVNAFVDALVCTVNVGVGARGADLEWIVDCLHEMRHFLGVHDQSLSFGTWDALVLRLLDTHSATPETDSGIIQRLVALSDGFGDGLHNINTQDLPAYVRDGSMAMQGVLHRALYGQIATGSFEGALEVFRLIQFRADKDKFKSVAAFFGRFGTHPEQRKWRVRKETNSLFQALNRQDMFTSDHPSIEYPSFDVRIPPTVLGPFLDQVTETGAFEFGRWLLYKNDVDGPVILASSYDDPIIQPALVRFAAASNDKALLGRFKESTLARASLRSIFDSQVQKLNWDAAVQVLHHLTSTPGSRWDNGNLAILVRTMLLQTYGANAGNSLCRNHVKRAQALVGQMVTLRYEGGRTASPNRAAAIQSVLTVLAAVNPKWFRFAYRLRPIRGHHDLLLNTRQFNIILEGVVAAYGSAAGGRLLATFWPRSARSAYDAAVRMVRDKSIRTRMPRFRPDILDSIKRQKIVITLAAEADLYQFVMYGALTPNINTILIILRKALEEIRISPTSTVPAEEQTGITAETTHEGVSQTTEDGAQKADMSPRGMVAWAVRRLAELPYVQGRIIEQLDDFLAEQGMDELRAQLPKIYQTMEDELIGTFPELDSIPIDVPSKQALNYHDKAGDIAFDIAFDRESAGDISFLDKVEGMERTTS